MRREASFFMWFEDRDVEVQVEGYLHDLGAEWDPVVETVWVNGRVAERGEFTRVQWMEIEESLIPADVPVSSARQEAA